MSLTVPPVLLEQAYHGEVDEADFDAWLEGGAALPLEGAIVIVACRPKDEPRPLMRPGF